MNRNRSKEEFLCAVDSDIASYRELLAALKGQFDGQVVASGREALRLASHRPPSLWLINTQLPDMRGSDLLDMLRQLASHGVYCLIGNHYDANEERAAHLLAAHAYLCKPLEPAWVLRIGQHFLGQPSRASPRSPANFDLVRRTANEDFAPGLSPRRPVK